MDLTPKVAQRQAQALTESLQAAWEGGPAWISPAVGATFPGLRAPAGSVVLPTSGSTGTPKAVWHDAITVRTMAKRSLDRLAGAGQWLSALPLSHAAGVGVLARSLVANTTVQLLTGPFTAAAFTAAAAQMTHPRRYVSLVPTQLHRLLQSAPATQALRSFAAVLLGGAAAPAPLLGAARAAGVAVVRSYGMTETAGGCVYDGVPLAGVEVAVRAGLVEIAGPLARGYLDADGELLPAPKSFYLREAQRWFRTADAGQVQDGKLQVLGRADEAIISGGVNVFPVAVEGALAGAGWTGLVVVGVPDPEWGELVVAVGQNPPSLQALREHLGSAPTTPRAVVAASIPNLASGKPDRRELRRIATLALRSRPPEGASSP